MSSTLKTSGWVSLAVLAGGLLSAGTLVAEDPREGMEEIVVQAPAEVERQQVSRAVSPTMKTEVVKLTRRVSLADLDLSKAEDIERLDQRIEWLARDSCDKLSDMFPFDESDAAELRRCTRLAIESAMEQKERAIASAH